MLDRNFAAELVRLGNEVHNAVLLLLGALVDVFDEVKEPVGVQKLFVGVLSGAIVVELDQDALVEKGVFAQPLFDHIIVEGAVLEDPFVGHKFDAGPLLVGLAYDGKRSLDDPALDFSFDLRRIKLLAVDLAVPIDFDVEPLGKSIGDAGAYAVQTAGVVIVFISEFSACVQLGKNEFDGGDFFDRVDVHGDPSTVVFDGYAPIGIDRDGDARSEFVSGFVHRVIDDFPDDVVHTAQVGISDVHTGTNADRLQPLKDVYITGLIRRLFRRDSFLWHNFLSFNIFCF